jgi:hypothetical protein
LTAHLALSCLPQEFIKQAWNKKAKLELAPNVSALIEDFNQVFPSPAPEQACICCKAVSLSPMPVCWQMSEWVSLVVLSYRDRKRRGEAISRFINIAYVCSASLLSTPFALPKSPQ